MHAQGGQPSILRAAPHPNWREQPVCALWSASACRAAAVAAAGLPSCRVGASGLGVQRQLAAIAQFPAKDACCGWHDDMHGIEDAPASQGSAPKAAHLAGVGLRRTGAGGATRNRLADAFAAHPPPLSCSLFMDTTAGCTAWQLLGRGAHSRGYTSLALAPQMGAVASACKGIQGNCRWRGREASAHYRLAPVLCSVPHERWRWMHGSAASDRMGGESGAARRRQRGAACGGWPAPGRISAPSSVDITPTAPAADLCTPTPTADSKPAP